MALGMRKDRPMHATNPGRYGRARQAHNPPPPPASWGTVPHASGVAAGSDAPTLAIHPPAPYHVTSGERARRSQRALAAERRIGRAAYLLDDVVSIPGTPIAFGLDPLIGLIPFVGDAVTALMGVWIILEAARFHLPKIVIVRMAINTGVDFVVGLLPFVGDLVDFGFKGNRRNLELFHRHAVDQDPNTRGSQALVIGLVLAVIAVIWLLAVVVWNLLSTVVG
jgi:hypothetical protein